MRKFIVPAKDRMKKWRDHFEDVFREDEHQKELMKLLITLVMFLAYDGNKKQNEFFELFESTLGLASELADTGVISDDDTDAVGQLAYEFCVSLAGYLKELGILSKVPTVLSFEGFVGMDIVIKVLDAGEPYVDEQEERACLSG